MHSFHIGGEVTKKKAKHKIKHIKTPSKFGCLQYTVTVKGAPETTRATVNADGKTMNFAADDELYISDGANIHGVLTLQSGAKSDEATFSGTLYYEASTPPNNSTSLTATLVSSNNQVAQKSDDKVTGFKYPTSDNVCSTLSEAVSKYNQLTGTGNYGSGEIVLFLPAAGFRHSDSSYQGERGYYWSLSLNTNSTRTGSRLYFDSDGANTNSSGRKNGFTVRPVHN